MSDDDQHEQDEGEAGGEMYDAPNQQAVGQAPPWVEGTGGEVDEASARVDDQQTEQMQAEDDGGESDDGLDAMTKEQLLGYARERGISPANESMTKAEVRAAIDRAERS